MSSDEDYYRVLGVLDDAEDIVIRAAYRALAQRYHPDKWEGDPAEAGHRMAQLNAAYAVLSNSVQRHAYDLTRSDTNSYRRYNKEAEAGSGGAEKSEPETGVRSDYAAAKGFTERAGRGSTSSSFKDENKEGLHGVEWVILGHFRARGACK